MTVGADAPVTPSVSTNPKVIVKSRVRRHSPRRLPLATCPRRPSSPILRYLTFRTHNLDWARQGGVHYRRRHQRWRRHHDRSL